MSRAHDPRRHQRERTPGQIWRAEFRRRLSVLWKLTLFLAVLVFVTLSHRIIHVVSAGHGGVLFRPFWGGVVTDTVYGEGLHLVWPWNRFHIYDYRIHERSLTVPILAQNGLTVNIDVSARFHPIREELPLLHREIGPDYIKKVVVPIVVSAVREVAGGFKHQKLFHASNSAVEASFLAEAAEEIKEKHVEFEEILVRRIELPEQINAAIQDKLREEERVEEYQFRVKRERLEADRKRIEGKGIQDFQVLVQKHLTTKMLYWRGIRATVDLARSENAKVVVIGSGGEGGTGLGLPIILGGWDGKAQDLASGGSELPSQVVTDPALLEGGVHTGYTEGDPEAPPPEVQTSYDLPPPPPPSSSIDDP